MKRYYVATSWDESGHSPSQEQIDQGIRCFQEFPSAQAYNVAYWQPHLENEFLVARIWQWIEHYARCRLDYKTMPLADKQVWFLVVPESLETENDRIFHLAGELIMTRNAIAKRISDQDFYFNVPIDGETNESIVRETHPRIYMQLHALMNYMHREYNYCPIILSKPSLYAREFNAEFGKYFHHNPVLPVVMATFFSKPRIVKHHHNKRRLTVNANGSLTAFVPYELQWNKDLEVPEDTTPCYWWQDGKMGTELTPQEKRDAHKLTTHNFSDDVSVHFDLHKDLF